MFKAIKPKPSTDGDFTAMHSKAISGWVDRLKKLFLLEHIAVLKTLASNFHTLG